MNLQVRSLDQENPFCTHVQHFFEAELPANMNQTTSLLESLTDAFVSTNKVRYGCCPTPESLVVIRSVIRNCIEEGKPIPVLCPWGSKKPKNNESIDIAEVMALKVLSCLQSRVQKYYEPGITVNIRIEDVSGYHLFSGQPGSRESSEKYVAEFLKLLKILDYKFINPIPESSLVSEQDFFSFAEEVKLYFLDYLLYTDLNGFEDIDSLSSWKKLKELKWSGKIPIEMRDFFRNQYCKMYPGIEGDYRTELLARYFAEAVARIHFGATGKEFYWGNDFIQLNFLSAAPGTPFDLVSNRLTYRSIPENFTRTHIPPWRAKGFLEIGNDYVKPKLISWCDPEIENLIEGSLIFSSGKYSVMVKADQKIV